MKVPTADELRSDIDSIVKIPEIADQQSIVRLKQISYYLKKEISDMQILIIKLFEVNTTNISPNLSDEEWIENMTKNTYRFGYNVSDLENIKRSIDTKIRSKQLEYNRDLSKSNLKLVSEETKTKELTSSKSDVGTEFKDPHNALMKIRHQLNKENPKISKRLDIFTPFGFIFFEYINDRYDESRKTYKYKYIYEFMRYKCGGKYIKNDCPIKHFREFVGLYINEKLSKFKEISLGNEEEAEFNNLKYAFERKYNEVINISEYFSK